MLNAWFKREFKSTPFVDKFVQVENLLHFKCGFTVTSLLFFEVKFKFTFYLVCSSSYDIFSFFSNLIVDSFYIVIWMKKTAKSLRLYRKEICFSLSNMFLKLPPNS